MIKYIKNGKNITFTSVMIFIIVVVLVLSSTYYMNYCIYNEENANAECAKYKQLGEDLADASDYLTNEVRLFAITHNIEHFYNYWREINDVRRRDNAIEAFEQSNSPIEETALLIEAKRYSDELVEIETCSMKMVLLSERLTARSFPDDKKLQSYVQQVMDYELPEKYKFLTTETYKEKGINLLYNVVYDRYKQNIMTPIDDFQVKLKARLDNELARAQQGTSFATVILVVTSAITLAAIGTLLFLLNKLYVIPIGKYTEKIGDVKIPEDKNGTYTAITSLAVKVQPQGAVEVEKLGIAFNMLSDTVHGELNFRNQAEDIMRRSQSEAETENRAKSLFLANMCHELRTPLNAVNGYSEILLETSLSERQESYVKGIRYSSESLIAIINDILDFSKFETGRLEIERSDFSLKELLNEVNFLISNLAKKKHLTFKLGCEENIPDTLIGDALRLKQVLVNLANNAVKFTSEGRVSVYVKLEEKIGNKCKLKFNVSDTGIGIDKSKINIIFKPFVQSDSTISRRYGGTGLGLPICQQIVSAWNRGEGRIEIESELGKGSEFSFVLDFEISDRNLKSENSLRPIYNGNTVLVVDDNEINLSVECELLRLCGLTAIMASSGEEALNILTEKSNVELVFMDLRMPDMDGYEAVRKIRKISEFESLPVIALSADVQKETEQKIKDSGMNGFLKKPFSQQQLYKILKSFILDYYEDDTDKKSYLEEASMYFSPERLLEKIQGNREVLETVLKMFIDEYKDFMVKINNLISSGNVSKASDLVHKLKGTSGTLCCNKLFEAADSLNTNLKKNSSNGFDEFKFIYEKTYTEIFEYYNVFVQDKHDNSEFSRKRVLGNLLIMSMESNFAVAAYFGNNISMLRRNCKSENFIAIKNAVEQLDFKGLEESVRKELDENV